MRFLWKVLAVFFFQVLPAVAAILYLFDYGGYRSRLGDAMSSITPILEVIVLLIVLVLGVIGAGLTVKHLWTFGRKLFHRRRYGDIQEFMVLRRALTMARLELIDFSNPYTQLRYMHRPTELEARETRFNTQFAQLLKRLDALGISIALPGEEDTRAHEILVRYVTTLEALAESGDLEAARELDISSL